MIEGKEILMNIYDKKFGKNFINYKVRNLKTNEIIDEGKCSDMVFTRKVYKGLMDEHGEDKVLLVMN